jgi:hypothetical protein
LLSPVFYYSFLACQKLYWPLGITIACHCDLFSRHASFGSRNVAPASFPNKNMNKGRWTQGKHKIFMQEYEINGNNCMQIAKVLSTRTPTQIKKHAECFFKQNSKTNPAAVKDFESPSLPMGKPKLWSNMPLNNKNINNLSRLRTKPKF